MPEDCARAPAERLKMPVTKKASLLKRYHAMIKRGEPIIGGGAGTGLSAKCEEAGGIDLIVIYNSGRFRMAGRGSLSGLMPYGDANAIVMEMAAEVLPVVKNVPVIAGVCGTDPFRNMDIFLDDVARIGFTGVQNFPTVGLIDGTFRANLEETGMGFALEVDMIRLANAKGMLTTPYVFCEADATAMAKAGADIIVCHLGLTTGGAIGAKTGLKLKDCPALVDRWAAAALKVKKDAIILVHGGPVAAPADADFIMKNTRNCHGFYGASSMERLPVEEAISAQTRAFKAISRATSTKITSAKTVKVTASKTKA
jgi:predicted TIM-barrel enzyme